MAKKLKKLLNYWFNPENYSIIKSINGIIDTVNELVDGGGGGYTLPIATTETLGGVKVDGTTITANGDGVISAIGGGGGSVENLNWTKVDTTVAIPALMDVVVNKTWLVSSSNFGISGTHKGLMLESNYFEPTGNALAKNNSLSLVVNLTDGRRYSIGNLSSTSDNEVIGAMFNRLRLYVVKNSTTGLYQMGCLATYEQRQTVGSDTVITESQPSMLKQEIISPIVPLSVAADIDSISISSVIKNETGEFATQGGVTFSLYVAD